MEKLIDLVKRYQRSSEPREQLELADRIVVRLSPDLHLYITLRSQTQKEPFEVDDVLQESLIGIALGLKKFIGESDRQFYGFCYDICRKRVVDRLRRDGRIRAHEFSGEKLWEAVLAAEEKAPLTQKEREKLREAMDLLAEVRPPCLEYLVARYINGMSFDEIREEFGFSSEDVAGTTTRRCLELARELVGV